MSYPAFSINLGIQLIKKYKVPKAQKNDVQSVNDNLRKAGDRSILIFPSNEVFFLLTSTTSGNSSIAGTFILERILLILFSALLGLFSKRYFKDSGIISQATATIPMVITPPNINIPRHPYSGKINPATTDVIIAPVG